MVNRAKRRGRRGFPAVDSHPRRLDGAIAIVLFLLPWAGAFVLVRRHDHLDGGTVAILVSVSLGLPTLWLMWTTYRGPKRSDAPVGSLTMAQIADQLSNAVGNQWKAEASIRRLNDPYPLPVSWIAADPSLTVSWDSVVGLATNGAGRPEPPPLGTWAARPEDLAGKGGELADVLARIPTGRLVVLGEPGAGKTMLMVRLLLDLLGRRANGGPVPFLASVASWDPTAQDLRDWLAAQLLIDHPALANPPPVGRLEDTQAAAVLASGLILPILDGLDEIPEEVRGLAIGRMNDALRPGEQLVVTCRTQQYRDAARPLDGIEETLRASAALELRPLDADVVCSYLLEDAGGPTARARWDPVLAVLGTETPAAQALSTPLMVGLARMIYNPRPGELAATLRDPAELCSPALADRAAVESLLFDAFIPAAYRHDLVGRWKVQDAERWLVFHARHLEQTIGSPDYAWWQLREAAPGAAFGVTAGVVALLLGALAGALVGRLAFGVRPALGVAVGLVAGTVFPLVVAAGPDGARAPARGMRVDVGAFVVGLGAGLLVGLLVGLTGGFVAGLGVGLVLWLTSWLFFGLVGVPGDLTEVVSPGAVLARDRRVTLLLVLAGGCAAGFVITLLAGVAGRVAAGLVAGFAAGLAVALAVGLVGGLVGVNGLGVSGTAWPSYMLTRGWLAFNHQLPWSLMSFLADAHKRGVLRQAGAVYQFRHIDLQHRLANRDERGEEVRSSAITP